VFDPGQGRPDATTESVRLLTRATVFGTVRDGDAAELHYILAALAGLLCPWLNPSLIRRGDVPEGQPAIYLRAQLQAFATGARHNDIGEQMRNLARRMTSEEIDAASRSYANLP
jgi:hypothetical protein